MNLPARVPWWAKMGIKLVLSGLPIPYSVWSKVGLFRHGDMTNPRRAIQAFRTHYESAKALGSFPDGFTMLELGPGDSVLSAGVARALGAAASYLVDAGDFARRDAKLFYDLDAALPDAGLPRLGLAHNLSFDAILAKLDARYLTNGIESLEQIPAQSIDLVWSSVALEHVHRDQFDRLVMALARVLKRGGVSSHAVDLRDHLGGSLNNLRFSAERWESPYWRRAGFYTNRMSQADIVEAFKRSGMRVARCDNDLWPAPPLPRAKMHPTFRSRNDDELRVAGFDLVMVRHDG
jgi:SAM-dependent methyltransferase